MNQRMNQRMNQVSRICPVTDTDAERLVRPGTFADLGARITAAPPAPNGPARTKRPAPARRRQADRETARRSPGGHRPRGRRAGHYPPVRPAQAGHRPGTKHQGQHQGQH